MDVDWGSRFGGSDDWVHAMAAEERGQAVVDGHATIHTDSRTAHTAQEFGSGSYTCPD